MEIGEAVQTLLSAEGRVDPYPIYEVLRAAGPVVPLADSYVAVTGYAEADAVLRNPAFPVGDERLFDRTVPEWRAHPSLVMLARSVLQLNPPDHERLRRLVSGAFTARRVAGLRAAIERLAKGYADRLADAAEVDFIAEFAYLLPVSVICELLGVPESDRPWFRPRAHDLTEVFDLRTSFEMSGPDTATEELVGYFAELVEVRRRDPGDDLTSALVALHDADPGRINHAELLANLTLLLLAGFETTTNLLGNGLAALFAHPVALAALRADPSLIGPYVEEMLRYDAPVQLTSRWTEQPASLDGVWVPRGAEVLLLIGAANRDPRRFAEPDRFDPARPGNQPLSFGGGAHYCLGAALARLEAQVAFPLLLARFPDLAPAGDPDRRDRLTLRGYATLPVRTRP
jgi:cytochrome P450